MRESGEQGERHDARTHARGAALRRFLERKGAVMRTLLWSSLAVIATSTIAGCTVDDTYANCVVDADCNDLDDICERLTLEDARGLIVTDGASCTHGCRDDLDCDDRFGFTGACYAIGGDLGVDPLLCYQRCVDDFDCDFAQICVEVERTTDPLLDFVCVPDNF